MYNSSYTKHCKVSGPTLVTSLNWTPIVEEYVLRVWITEKQSCSKQIGLHAQNQLTILGSWINIWDLDHHSREEKKKSLLWYWIEYSYKLQNHEENAHSLHLDWISSETNQFFNILKAVVQSETVTIQDMSTLVTKGMICYKLTLIIRLSISYLMHWDQNYCEAQQKVDGECVPKQSIGCQACKYGGHCGRVLLQDGVCRN